MPKQSRITGAISLVATQAVVLLFGYATHLWIGRVLGPGPYGIYGVVLSVQTILGMLVSLSIPMAISRFVAQNEQYAHSILRQALRIQLVLALVVSAATLILAPLISRLLGDVALTNLIRFVAAILLAQAFYQVYVQFFSGMHRFNRQALLTSIYAVIKLVAAISLLYVLGIYGAFAGFGIGGLIAAALGWWWARRLGGTKPKLLPIKTILSFAGLYMLVLVGLQILLSMDLFMVKAILKNDVLAGYYNAAVTLSRISYFLLQALTFVLLPSVSALTKSGAPHDAAAEFIKDTLRYLIALIIPGIALAAATSQELVILFFSQTFIPAAPALTILMVGVGSLGFYLLLLSIVAGAGRARVALLLTVGLIIISVAAGLILIPRFGLIGAAWQTTSAGLVGLAVLATYTFWVFRIPVPVKSTINIVIASAVAIAPTYVWKVAGLMVPVQYLALLSLYLLTLLALGEISAADRQRLAAVHPLLKYIAPREV